MEMVTEPSVHTRRQRLYSVVQSAQVLLIYFRDMPSLLLIMKHLDIYGGLALCQALH